MNITIVGLGLIGASMGLAFRAKGHCVTGVELLADRADFALRIGAADSIASMPEAFSCAQLVVLAIPVDAVVRQLPMLLSRIPSSCVLIDTGSVKHEVCQVVANHVNRRAFVAVHPMTGCERGGPSHASALLFQGAKVVICDRAHSGALALRVALAIIRELGALPLFCSALQHDRMVALVSHLPQLLSYVYAGLPNFDGVSWRTFASTGFASFSRLAASPWEVWNPIFSMNGNQLIPLVNSLIDSLHQVVMAMEQNDPLPVTQLVQHANATRAMFDMLWPIGRS